MNDQHDPERIQTVVVGGGQAGLSVGYHLARRGLPFFILDASERIGDAWRNRWDSLRLFTPARYAGLAGWPFPSRGGAFPTKQEMADYLESYAERFHLPVRTGVKVDGLSRRGDQFVVTAGDLRFECAHVVVAMANYQVPRVPSFARDLDSGIVQLHSHRYRNPSQLQDGGVLVVGVGNSGADIGVEVARTRRTWMSGKESGHIPFPIDGILGRYFLMRLVRFLGHHVLTVSTPIGRKLRPKLLSVAAPLVRVKPKDLTGAGIERVPRVVGARAGRPLLADGRTLDVANVIWCTGYHPGFSWIHLPIFGDDGEPLHERGVVARAPGMYFVGLHYLYSMTSATLTGVGRDAERVARAIESRARRAQRFSRTAGLA
ncbi:MAG: portal protein [Anaeromyxobacter sp. RBG_16_69_14]|nr:MAG: portal protein [Anaeromyxobacter sp. RBG_16_69_14]